MIGDGRLRSDGAAFALLAAAVLAVVSALALLATEPPFGGPALWLLGALIACGVPGALGLSLLERDRRWARWKAQDDLETGLRTVLEIEGYEPGPTCETPH